MTGSPINRNTKALFDYLNERADSLDTDAFKALLHESMMDIREVAVSGTLEPPQLHYLAVLTFMEKVDQYGLDKVRARKWLDSLERDS